ncbi:MAG: hypothetical protein ACRBBR_09310 [Cellvibrionaceae bacterium]
MSYWPVVFIVLAIAMVVGPIMIMKPSRRDQRLASLRQKAASLGLQVRMSDYEGRATAVYSFPVDLPKNTPAWQLLKQSYSHGIHFHGRWQLLENSAKVPTGLENTIKHYIDNLYDDVVGIEVDKKAVRLWWLENPKAETVEDIQESLKQLYKAIAE